MCVHRNPKWQVSPSLAGKARSVVVDVSLFLHHHSTVHILDNRTGPDCTENSGCVHGVIDPSVDRRK